jgi:hypothetical protein
VFLLANSANKLKRGNEHQVSKTANAGYPRSTTLEQNEIKNYFRLKILPLVSIHLLESSQRIFK